jgi:type 2 lantibiotic biosynthesis protein LanM
MVCWKSKARARSMAEPIDAAYLRRVVEGASTISERLHGSFQPVETNKSAELAGERLEAWRAKISGTNPSAFSRRLSWLTDSPEQAGRLLGEVRYIGALPSWTEFLARTLDGMSAERVSDAFSCPFGPLIAPFAEHGRVLIAPAFAQFFSAQAVDALIDDLAKELSHIAAPIFYLKFSVLRSTCGGVPAGPPSIGIYDRFVRRLRGGGIREFFLEYPVLARLLCTTLEDFVRNSIEMANALSQDWTEISQVFSAGKPSGMVSGLRSSLSDRHNGGRTVSLLEFENGVSIVYKPRDIGIEKAWFDFLAELNEAGGEFCLLKVVAKQGHGWVEAARAAPCADIADLERYYRRAGMLLCVLYAMEASDCFFENIVACGAYPLLIDMETLMHPVVRGRPDLSPAEEIADDIIFNSVFRAGFLPAWEMGPSGHCVDISGLGAEPGQVTSYVKRSWQDVNTDAMSLGQQQISIDSGDHLPSLNGQAVHVADHVADVVDGFRHIYLILMANAARLTAPDGLARRFERSEIRFVFHATRIYGLVLKRLGAPRHMRSGIERGIEMDVISRFYLESHKQDRFRDILDAEIAALDRLDIPKFTVRADQRSLRLPTGADLKDIFEQSAIERVQRRIRSFSEDDMRLQCNFIRSSLSLASAIILHQPTPELAGDDAPETAAFAPAELVAEAQAIGEDLSVLAIQSTHGGATWIAPQLLPGANRHEFRPLRMDLYSGLAGVALFFAALYRTTGTGRDMALAALVPLRGYVRSAEPQRMVRDGYTLGGATGAGSFVASLTWCAELLGEPALRQEAIAFSAKITPDWIRDDDAFDVMGGSAGAILGLLCLYKRSGDPGILAKAVACGDHLLNRAEPVVSGIAWPTLGGGRHLTGFSHGVAGIAASLYRLGAAAGAPRFIETAKRAVAYENSVFDPDHANWPDFRGGKPGEPHFMHNWCHGAPGIGLGRAISADGRDDGACRTDLETALRTTQRYGIGDRDGLCCGALGRAELFVVKAVMDQDRAAEERAQHWAAMVVQRKRRSGGYRLTGRRAQEFFDPSFFQGLSGIGYQLLRIANPRLLPSVLTWE